MFGCFGLQLLTDRIFRLTAGDTVFFECIEGYVPCVNIFT